MKTRRDFLKLLGKVVVVGGVAAVVPSASLFGAPVPTVSGDPASTPYEYDVTAEPMPPQHKHDYDLRDPARAQHTHMIHEWEMPRHG